MKKKPLLVNSLLLLPLVISSSLFSMEKNTLEGSVMITPMHTERGLGFMRSASDVLWEYEEENIYKDLRDKTFKVNNSSYHRKLDTAVEIFVTKKNNPRLTEIFSICRVEYPKQIKISDSSARMAHEFLVQENKNKQSALKEEIEAKDKLFIEEQNDLFGALQNYLKKQIKKISNHLSNHLQESKDLVAVEGDDIRRVKKALLQLHQLNTTFKLPKNTSDGYCSDEDKDPDNVTHFYNDKNLLTKINIAYSMNNTKEKTEQRIKRVDELNQAIQEIQSLHS